MRGLNKKTLKKLPIIIKMLKTTDEPVSKIALKNNTTITILRRIADANGISEERFADKRKNKDNVKRDAEIISLMVTGNYSYHELSDKYSITPQRVQQITKSSGILLHGRRHEIKDEIVDQIKEDISVLTYSEIREKYNKFNDKYNWGVLSKLYQKKFGESIWTIMKRERDNFIVSKYSAGHTALKILASEEKEFKSPIHFTGINNIYRISSNKGVKKFPQIKNRAAGGVCEDVKILKKVVKMRKKGKSFNQISEYFNKKGIKTITGKSFTPGNTNRKYHDYINKGLAK